MREGVITGSFTAQEATDLAVILRAGALPIPIVIEEERTIGPALGQDSIRSGLLASLAGLAVIVLFVVGYYRMSGGFASVALLANLLLLLGLMSLFEGTLTLPGIAGLVRGDHPRLVEEQLKVFLAPKERPKGDGDG